MSGKTTTPTKCKSMCNLVRLSTRNTQTEMDIILNFSTVSLSRSNITCWRI